MGRRVRALLATLLVVAVPAVTIRLLHAVGDRTWFQIEYSDLDGWLATTDLVDALTAVARLVALGLAYYLLVSTVLYLVALASGSRSLIRITRPLAIPMVRTLADRVVAGSIAVSAIAAPLLASAPPASEATAVPAVSAEVAADYLPPSRIIEPLDAVDGPPSSADASVTFAGRPTTPPPDPIVTEPATEVRAGPTEVVVEEGDHLWGLAEERIGEALGRAALEHEVAPYWRTVVDENLARIRSGNPDVIFPGEIILLPDPTPHLASS